MSESRADQFIGSGGIKWRTLGERLVTSFWLRVGALVAGLIGLIFDLIGSMYETVYKAQATLLGLPFNGWESLLATAWDTAAQSIGGFGLAAWAVAVVVIAGFFLVLGRALRTLIEGVTP